MSIQINNGVTNVNGTPGAITGLIADRPSANDLPNGTLYFAKDELKIYQVATDVTKDWILYSGGGSGGSQNLQQVLDIGNIANFQSITLTGGDLYSTLNYDYLKIQDSDSGSYFQFEFNAQEPQTKIHTANLENFQTAGLISLADITTYQTAVIEPENFNLSLNDGSNLQNYYLKRNTFLEDLNFNRTIYFPRVNGQIETQEKPFIQNFDTVTANFTPIAVNQTGMYKCVDTGSFFVNLNPANFTEGVRIYILKQDSGNLKIQAINGGSFYGASPITGTGMFSIIFTDSEFYISHF